MRGFYHLNFNLHSPLTLLLPAMISLRINWHKPILGFPGAAKDYTATLMGLYSFFLFFFREYKISLCHACIVALSISRLE